MSKRKVSDDELTDQEIVDNDSNESSKKKYPCMVQKWTKEEDEKLIKLVEKYNSSKKTNWNLIAKHIAGRNFMQCRSRWDLKFNPKYILLSWTSDEDKKLIDLVGKLGENWEEISKQMNGRTNRQCRDRWLNKLTPKYVVGSWTSEEDEKLTSLIKKYGTKWAQISTLMNGRTPKQCRVRWVKHVDPEIDRGIWTIEEDNRLMELVTKLGPNWARISEIISKRTYDQCRNRWIYTLCPDFSKECWTFLEDEKLVKFVKKYGKDWPKISKLLKNRNNMQCRKRWNSMVLSDPSLKTIELPETSSSNSNEIKDKNKGGSSQKKKKKKKKKEN
ncbi:hypothetical protein RDWZM_007373 [Blomia tropicalis]|uniref:Uncharacterized protein n=1 Tax=Blomia tropicalis TaxID=40697 RepID=A0A9Q0RJ19_BLOTA|nr:hypothetical protein RDWZM_007373 [Blomia tropicalis]